jgi:hypothetical protein
MELATRLTGTARSVPTDVDPQHRQDYAQLVKALLNRFEPENQSEVFRAQLKSRCRKRSEDLAELAQDVKKLARKAYPGVEGGLRDTLTKDAFIDALNDGDMEWFVRQGKSSAPDGALQLALEYEAFQNGRQRRHGPKVIVRGQVEANSGNELGPSSSGQADEIVGRIAQLIQKSTVTPVPKQEKGACFICGSLTHFKWECPKRKAKLERAQVGKCDHCGIPGHIEADCYKKKRGIPKKQMDIPQVGSTGQGNGI